MKRLLLPFGLLALALALVAFNDLWLPLASRHVDEPMNWALLAVWVAITLILIRALEFTLWRWLRARSGSDVPKLLLTITAITIWTISLGFATVQVFSFSPTGLLTTSSLFIGIVGFAMRNLIADVFFGITMTLERPFEIGDWIDAGDGTVGEVKEFTWRATQIVTREEIKIVVPNSILAGGRLTNYSRPTPVFRSSFTIPLPYEVTTEAVERLLASAVMQVPESAAIDRKPEARIKEFENSGVEWEMRFWVPDYPRSSSIAYAVRSALLRNMRFNGTVIAREKGEVYVQPLMKERRREAVLKRDWVSRVSLFSHLGEPERQRLRQLAKPKLFRKGSEIIRQGASGESLFVLQEGFCSVLVRTPEDKIRKVATLRPGDFCGEMSLLTGAERAATVRTEVDSVAFEVTRAHIAPALKAHPKVVEALGLILAEREQATQERLVADRTVIRGADATVPLGRMIAARIRKFFELEGA